MSFIYSFHGRYQSLSEYSQLPQSARNRISKSYSYVDTEYDPRLFTGDIKFLYSYGTAYDKSGCYIISLADNTIIYKYPTGSYIILTFESLKECIKFWDSYIKLPIHKIPGADSNLTHADAILIHDIEWDIQDPNYDNWIYKGKVLPPDRGMVIPAGTEVELYDEGHGKLSFSFKNMKSAARDYILVREHLGYTLRSKSRTGEYSYYFPLNNVPISRSDIEVISHRLLEGIDLADYSSTERGRMRQRIKQER